MCYRCLYRNRFNDDLSTMHNGGHNSIEFSNGYLDVILSKLY